MDKSKYPYVVLRAMAAVYVKRLVRFVDEPTEPLNKTELVICFPGAFKGGRLTAEARRRLIEEVKARAQSSGCRQCIVFGPRSALYFEPDGNVNRSRQPPGGGVMLKGDVVTNGGKSILE
jgi:hypothetical protein